MPAYSTKQRKAAEAAMASKRSWRSTATLAGPSRQMARSMSEDQLRDFARKTRRKRTTAEG